VTSTGGLDAEKTILSEWKSEGTADLTYREGLGVAFFLGAIRRQQRRRRKYKTKIPFIYVYEKRYDPATPK
jgi:hypothetical protein